MPADKFITAIGVLCEDLPQPGIINQLLLIGVMIASSNVLVRQLMSDSPGLMSEEAAEDRK